MDKNHWQLGKWWGIPVSLHWSVLLWCALFFSVFMDIVPTIVAALALIFVMVVHECGHVLALRARKLDVDGVELSGLHGITETTYLPYPFEIVFAWSGVAAQFVLYLISEACISYVHLGLPAYLDTVIGPVALVFTRYNLLLMVVALIPIGPFDGRRAWKILGWLRTRVRAALASRQDGEEKTPRLTREQQRALEEASAKEARELLEKISKSTRNRNEDR